MDATKLTSPQINELLSIIDRNQSVAFGNESDPDFLTKNDKQILAEYGVDVRNYTKSTFSFFHLGMLSDSLQALQEKGKVSYDDLKDYVKKGQYIPLTAEERATINSIKTQSLASVKDLNGKIFQDVNGILEDHSRKAQEEFLRNEVLEGYLAKRTTLQIARDISHKTGDWNRDFASIVEDIFRSADSQLYTSFSSNAKSNTKLKQPRPKVRAIINGKEVWI